MAGIRFTDNAKTKLATGISAGDTVLSVTTTTGSKLPVLIGTDGNYAVLTIEDSAGNREFVKVSKRTGDTLGDGTYPCVRAYWGSAPRAWPSGVTVDIRWSAGAIQEYMQNLSGRYLGSFTGAPTTDSFGGALKSGDLYLENATGTAMRYTGSSWVSAFDVTTALPKSGGTMTGPLVLSGEATAPLHPVAKQQMDATANALSALAANALNAADAALDAAAAAQATATAALPKAGGVMTGPITLAGSAGAAMQPVPLQQMQAAVMGRFIRQAVLDGVVDANGASAFLTPGTGRFVTLLADILTPLVVSAAAGFDGFGPVDTVWAINADAVNAWGQLPANATSFLFVDVWSSLSYEVGTKPPVYGPSFFAALGDRTVSLLHMDNNGADENTDHTWTAAGNASFGGTAKFGTKALVLDGTGDWLSTQSIGIDASRGFEMSVWFNASNFSNPRYIFGGDANTLTVGLTPAGKLTVYLGNGASWSIASGVLGTTTVTAGAYHRVRLQYDGATYRVYLSLNGATETLEISVASAVSFQNPDTFYLGCYAAGSAFLGSLDEWRFFDGPQVVAAVTPPAAAWASPIADGEHWFDTKRHKMYERVGGAWVERHRVCVGEATCDASSVTSVTAYALHGIFDSGWKWAANGTGWSVAHNLGIEGEHNVSKRILYRQNSGCKAIVTDGRPEFYVNSGGVSYGVMAHSFSRNAVSLVASGLAGNTYMSGLFQADKSTADGGARAFGQVRTIIERGW